MDDVWFGPGLTHLDWEMCIAALSLNREEPPPLIAIVDQGSRLAMSSHALIEMFGVNDGDSLSSRLLGGRDPGARRLAALCHQLPISGAPRLERLRFFIGPVSKVVTFLCRRIQAYDEQPMFVAAALSLQPRQCLDERVISAPAVSPASDSMRDVKHSDLASTLATSSGGADRPGPGGVQALRAALHTRWPTNRSVRFLWQTDVDLVCTLLSSPLADVVGAPNSDLIGRDMLELAPRLDPTGRLARALAEKKTWSGMSVAWPVSDALASIEIELSAVPTLDRNRNFAGFGGYGVIRLDRVVASTETRLVAPAYARPILTADNVVTFPAKGKVLSPEDQIAFVTLGVELRDHVGPLLVDVPIPPPEVASAKPVVSKSEPSSSISGVAGDEPPDPPEKGDLITQAGSPTLAHAGRAEEVARNGLAMLDRLPLALLVSRDNVPIFANRRLLELTGFANEDALYLKGGMAYLFDGTADHASGAEEVGIRGADGTIGFATARMKRIEWDGLPATLLLLQPREASELEVQQGLVLPGTSRDQHSRLAHTIARSTHDDDELHELRAILDTSADAVAVIDAQCNVVSLNRAGEALFGCDRSAVIGRPFVGLFAAHNQSLAAEYLDGLKSSPTKSLLNDGREFLVKAHQGTIAVFMTLGRLGNSRGENEEMAPRFCALFRDLTPWKRVEQELESARHEAERASALKSDFLAKVSHEIRTPLNAIMGFAEVILQERFGPLGSDRYREYLADIHASGEHVMSLVNDLLDLSKIEAGKMQLAVDLLDLNKIVSECVALMQPQANRDRIIMRLSLATNLPQVKADERSIRQIVLNLLSNAVKFNDPGGQVIVSTAAAEGGPVAIRVRDTGPGMSEDDIVAALEPFRQLATSRPAMRGTGLGLPLTKALVEANEATFTIRSKVDEGTLVEVSFPLTRVSATERNV